MCNCWTDSGQNCGANGKSQRIIEGAVSRALTGRCRSRHLTLDEALFAAEILMLHATPVYYGFGVPRGDGSGVVVIPGFLGTDLYLMELHAWLGRIGYRPYFSGIGINAECPNLLVQRHLNETIERALAETGRKIHLIGHSLGGVIARSVAGQRPRDVASVITLASPIRGTATSRAVFTRPKRFACASLGAWQAVLPACYTGRCTCNFVDSLRREVPDSMLRPRSTPVIRHRGLALLPDKESRIRL